jgi:hypothetical protein
MPTILNDARHVLCRADVRRRAARWEPMDALLAHDRLGAVPAPGVECFAVLLEVRDDSAAGAQDDSQASGQGDSHCLARGGCRVAGWD